MRSERDRTEAMLAEIETYDGPDQEGALWGEIDCRIELMILSNE